MGHGNGNANAGQHEYKQRSQKHPGSRIPKIDCPPNAEALIDKERGIIWVEREIIDFFAGGFDSYGMPSGVQTCK
jgi:hypothetical protein